MKCPVCGESAERGRPIDADYGWARDVEPKRLEHRHAGRIRDALCPVMTKIGYQPAMPKK